MSVYNTILDACVTAVQGLSLSGIDPAQVKKRKLPKASETLDTLPCVIVAPSEEAEDIRHISFEDSSGVDVVYKADVVVIAADNHDFSTNLPTYLDWREQIRRLFQPPRLAGASTVWDTEVRMFSPLDRSLLAQNYAYVGLTVLFHSKEQRS